VLALFVAGVAALRLDRRSGLLLALLGYYNLIHVATHGFARYRLPVMPVLFLVAGSAWTAWRAGDLRVEGFARRALAAALALVLGACLAPTLASNLRHTAFGFTEPLEPAAQEPPRP
jgi:hypothetical protein